MNELRDSGVDPLIIDAGDLFFSTASLNSTYKKSELYRAGAILEGYNRVGCDAINVGHYEVLNGLSFLKSMVFQLSLLVPLRGHIEMMEKFIFYQQKNQSKN